MRCLKNINFVTIATFYMKLSNYSLINITIGPTFNDDLTRWS